MAAGHYQLDNLVIIVDRNRLQITGVVSMYALQLASGTPSALVDWNNNYADDPNKCVLFHCGNWAKSFFDEDFKMEYAPILGSTLGDENTYGVVAGGRPRVLSATRGLRPMIVIQR